MLGGEGLGTKKVSVVERWLVSQPSAGIEPLKGLLSTYDQGSRAVFCQVGGTVGIPTSS